MALKEMYPGMINSPETTITNNINESDTIIYVLDPARVPEPPNLMTLGTGTNAETVKVLEINDNAITVERGFQGVPKAWPAGTVIARNFTEYDYNALKENIEDLEATKETPQGAQEKADAALNSAKQYTDQEVGEVAQALAAHLADYAKEATEFTIESDDIYERENCKYYKKNGFVFLALSGIQKKDASEFAIGEYIARLPVGFRPKQALYVQGMGHTGTVRKPVSLIVYPTGQVQMGQASSDTFIRLSITYYAGGGTV